ncbi:MAG: DMT family transporter [Candidatus Cloacimonetes bacterium]|nr:DMT family transporter [Candidatus Cloacimonadota bacterium]
MVSNQKKAYIYGLIAIFFWSTVASAFKIALQYNSPPAMLLLASFFSLLVLIIIAASQNKISLLWQSSPHLLRQASLLGVLNPFLYYLILLQAYNLLPAQIAQPLNYTWAIMVALLSIFIQKQKLRYFDIVALLLCYSGAAVISSGGGKLGEINHTGVFLALFSSIVWAFYWIYNAGIRLDPLIKLIANFFCGSLLILGYCLITGDLPIFSVKSILSALYLGIFEMGLTFVFWLKAMELTEKTVRISNLIFLSPFLSFIFITLTLKEPIAWTSIAGLIFITSGILFQHSKAGKLKKLEQNQFSNSSSSSSSTSS